MVELSATHDRWRPLHLLGGAAVETSAQLAHLQFVAIHAIFLHAIGLFLHFVASPAIVLHAIGLALQHVVVLLATDCPADGQGRQIIAGPVDDRAVVAPAAEAAAEHAAVHAAVHAVWACC